MKWTKFTLKTTTEAVDLISSMLDEFLCQRQIPRECLLIFFRSFRRMTEQQR